MKALNKSEDYAAAGWKEYRFHIIEKTLLNQVLIRIPVPSPEEWPKLLTGPRAQLAEFLCTKPPGDMLNEVWYALDIRKATVRDGLVVYPVIAKNKELIEVSKALQAHLQRGPA
jgi:hypothetical protein